MSGHVIITRWVYPRELEAALTIAPEGFRVGVNPSHDIFAGETVPVEWVARYDGAPTEDVQRGAMVAVDVALVEAGITIAQTANSIAPDPA